MAHVLDLWYQALSTEHGIAVSGAPSDRLKAALYAKRTEAKDPALASLTLLTSIDDPANEVWIVHKPEQSNAA